MPDVISVVLDDNTRKAKRLLIEQNRARKAAEQQMQMQIQQQQQQHQQQSTLPSTPTVVATSSPYANASRVYDQTTTSLMNNSPGWTVTPLQQQQPEMAYPMALPQYYPVAQGFRLAEQVLPEQYQTRTSREATTSKTTTTTATTTHSSGNSKSTTTVDTDAVTSSVVEPKQRKTTKSQKSAPQRPIPSLPDGDEDDNDSDDDSNTEDENDDDDDDDDDSDEDSDESFNEDEFPKCYTNPHSEEAALHFTQAILEAMDEFYFYTTQVVSRIYRLI